jgi:hypothetical protein
MFINGTTQAALELRATPPLHFLRSGLSFYLGYGANGRSAETIEIYG